MGVHEDILNFEMKILKLRVDYDQYFAGIIKIPPFKLHEEVKRFIRNFSPAMISNTGLKFKYNSIVGRYTSYNNLWTRVLRQIDEGTYRRGTGLGTTPHAREAVSANESSAERLYKDYVAARQTLNQKSDDIKVQNLQALMEKQTAAIKAKYKVKDVEYKVVTEGGKAKIKAIPRK